MNPITPWLVCVALLAMLIGVVYVAIKTSKTQKNEIKQLSAELESQKAAVKSLIEHADELKKIKCDKEEVAQKISEAKDEEEVSNIIIDLVRANNDRVRK